MKLINILLCLLISINTFCQEKELDGFWGIKFGTSKEKALEIMLENVLAT